MRCFAALFVLVLFSIANSSSAQTIEAVGKNKYNVDGVMYDYSGLADLMQYDEEAMGLYEKSIASRENGIGIQRFSGGAAVVSTGLIIFSDKPCFGCGNASHSLFNLGVFGLVVITPVTLLIGTFNRISGKKARKQAIQLYNEHITSSQSLVPQLRLGPTSNGVGLTLVF